jgi:hypothetical protein
MDYLSRSLAHWERNWSRPRQRLLMAQPPFAHLMRTVRALAA